MATVIFFGAHEVCDDIISEEGDVIAWIKEHTAYSAEHCRGLVMHGVGAGLKKKARKDLEERIDKILRFRS